MTTMTVVQFFAMVLWLVGLKLAVASTDQLEEILGAAVLEALERSRVTVKEASALMKLDESNLRKQLRGEPGNHLSLTRLVRLPYTFWLWFSPSLIYLVARKNHQEIVEAISLRKVQ